jgi:aspartate aminotransferase
VRRRCRVFQHRRDLLLQRFEAIPHLYTPRPLGAFYLFPDMRAFIGRTAPDGRLIADDIALASYLLDEGVAVVPGSGFGMPGFIRLSYATSDDNLHLAADRLARALEALS